LQGQSLQLSDATRSKKLGCWVSSFSAATLLPLIERKSLFQQSNLQAECLWFDWERKEGTFV
jgi:hypothetical protein